MNYKLPPFQVPFQEVDPIDKKIYINPIWQRWLYDLGSGVTNITNTVTNITNNTTSPVPTSLYGVMYDVEYDEPVKEIPYYSGPILVANGLTSVTSQTGTGTTFVMNTSPTLITPALGTPTALVGTNITGTAAGLSIGGNAATVTTNANLTGPITSVGNATSIAAQTGTGSVFVVQATPSLSTTVGVGGATAANTGAGVTFPASMSASTDANTLDDYEEGTWTPVDASGASLAFTSNGYYTKIGNLVTVQAYIEFPVTADATAVKIGGFPFTSANGTNQYSSTVCLTNANIVSNLLVDGGATAFQLRTMTNSTVPNLTFSAQFIIFTISYMT